MITTDLAAIKKISSSSLSGLAQNVDFNFNKIVSGLNSFLTSIAYDGTLNKMVLNLFDVKGNVQVFSQLGFGPDRLNPTLKITADGKLTGQALDAPVINVTRLRFRDFQTVSTISKAGIPGEVVYVGPGPFTEGIYAYLISTGWTLLSGSGGGGGGGATALSQLTDVLLNNVSGGDFLQYNTTDNRWENTQFTINPTQIFEALNVDLTAPFVPYWDGTILTNSLMTNDVINSVVNVNGELTATSKSFLIPHPEKKGHMLRYGSLEGPEHAVYFRGRSFRSVIKLPKYWKSLIDESTISVSLTPIGMFHELFVDEVSSSEIRVGGSKVKNYFFIVFAERKDIDKLTVEFKNKKTK